MEALSMYAQRKSKFEILTIYLVLKSCEEAADREYDSILCCFK